MLRVLLIEDNALDHELVERTLARLTTPPGPCEITTASRWSEADQLLATRTFELVLLDFGLPDSTGLDVLRHLSDRPHPPVIMLTGQADLGTAVETLRAGAADYVPKGGDNWGPALRLAIERVLERERLARDLAAAQARLRTRASELEELVANRTTQLETQAAEFEALYLQAEEAARIKEEIVANVSHELRTPLNVVLGYVDLLTDTLPVESGAEARAMLARVADQSHRLYAIIESLLTLRDLRAGRMAPAYSRFPLHALVDELETDVALASAHTGVTVTWEHPDRRCEVVQDREKVRRIATHLIQNALKFTSVGNIRIAVDVATDDTLVLSVEDTGTGFPTAAIQHCLEDFQQLDGSTTRRYEGLGLGLGIVKRLTALLGGTMDVRSTPGEGTSVAVALPRGVVTAQAADEEPTGLGLNPIQTAKGPCGITSVVDISEHKRAADSMRQMNNDLKEANREIEAFTYSVSHDLRAPLRAINGYAQILTEDCATQLNDEGKRLLGTVSEQARYMGELIDDLLAFSRLGSRELAAGPVDMAGLAALAAADIQRCNPGRTVALTVHPLPAAHGDAALLRQVFASILGNAWKFTGHTADPQIEVGNIGERGMVTYFVRDNGVGFDMAFADKLFGVFERLHAREEFPGTGAGLALVQRIIHRHGGRVWAEGTLDKGATFYFTLPHAEASDATCPT